MLFFFKQKTAYEMRISDWSSDVCSSDLFGRTWGKPALSPIYAHRPCVKPLQNGKFLVSFRNAWGTPGSCLFVFHPEEKFNYQPNSYLWDQIGRASCRERVCQYV